MEWYLLHYSTRSVTGSDGPQIVVRVFHVCATWQWCGGVACTCKFALSNHLRIGVVSCVSSDCAGACADPACCCVRLRHVGLQAPKCMLEFSDSYSPAFTITAYPALHETSRQSYLI
jgi:hypothetical protein